PRSPRIGQKLYSIGCNHSSYRWPFRKDLFSLPHLMQLRTKCRLQMPPRTVSRQWLISRPPSNEMIGEKRLASASQWTIALSERCGLKPAQAGKRLNRPNEPRSIAGKRDVPIPPSGLTASFERGFCVADSD